MPTPLNISGSRAAAILGLSQYQTPLQVWLQIMGREFCEQNNYEYPVFEGNAATRFGSAFETAIINYTERKFNSPISDREKVFEDDYMTCHIDARMADDILIENKTTYSGSYFSEWGEPGTDRIPQIYQIQVQHNLMLTKFSKCILPVLIFPVRQEEMLKMGIIPEEIDTEKWVEVLAEMGFLKFYEIYPHEELQGLLRQHYADFWNNHVLTGVPPEPKNYDDIRAICREPVGTIIATPEINNLIAEYKSIGNEISSTGTLAKRREQLKTQILNFSRTAGFVEDDESRDKWIIRSTDGKKLASYGRDSRGNFIFR